LLHKPLQPARLRAALQRAIAEVAAAGEGAALADEAALVREQAARERHADQFR
jgi:hypothetical protein